MKIPAGLIEEYLSWGFTLIPVKYGDKLPDAKVLPKDEEGKPTWKPFQVRKPTDDEIRQWFFSGEPRNIGVVLGNISNNLFVIDLDSEELVEYLKERCPKVFEKTLAVKTGRGAHLYFYGDIALPTMKFETEHGKMEIRGEGAYTLLPPSLHPSGKNYEFITKRSPMKTWLPDKGLGTKDFLLTFFRELFPEACPQLIDQLGTKVYIGGTLKKFPDLPPCLANLMGGVPEGMRNESCFLLAAYLTKILPVSLVKELMLLWNKENNPPLPENEVKRTVESAARYEISCEAIRSRLKIEPHLCEICPMRAIMAPLSEFYRVEPEEVEMETEPTPSELKKIVPMPELRPGQLDAIVKILRCPAKNIVLKAPTGWGKTIVFLAAAKEFAPSIIVEPYKALQDQMAERYGVLVVKGKANYTCPLYKVTADIAPCNFGEQCRELCPYRAAVLQAKETLNQGGVIVCNHGNYMRFTESASFIVYDEFHKILEELTAPIRLYNATPDDVENLDPDVILMNEIKNTEAEIESLLEKITELKVGTKDYNMTARRINTLRRRLEKLNYCFANLTDLVIYYKKESGKVYAKLDEEHTLKRLLKIDKRKMFVSATPLTVPGVTVIEGNAEFISRVNAPIIYFPVDKLTVHSVKNDMTKLKKAADMIKIIYGYLRNNGKTKKAIVHTGNIRLHGRKIAKYLAPYKCIIHELGNLEKSLKEFKESDADFLVVASGDVGFDFYGADYGIQFIAKVPYPSWDEEWQARAKKFGYEKAIRDYNKKTVDTILQICGRICRGGDDTGYTIIMDEKFEDLYDKYYEFFDDNFRSRLIDLSPNRALEKINEKKKKLISKDGNNNDREGTPRRAFST